MSEVPLQSRVSRVVLLPVESGTGNPASGRARLLLVGTQKGEKIRNFYVIYHQVCDYTKMNASVHRALICVLWLDAHRVRPSRIIASSFLEPFVN